jgi:HD-like signal output (HDOD) protein
MNAAPLPRAKLLSVATELPAGPRILALLGRRLLNLNTDLADIADLIRCDPALTARIVRVANSVAYGSDSPLASLEEALARVGFVEVYRLTGFVSVAQISEADLALYGITGAQFRENSLLTALMMEQMADYAQLDPREAYTAGLLRSVGKIALNRFAAKTPDHISYATEGRGPLAAWETAVLGLNNCEATALILAEWRFPAETTEAIRAHYATPPDDTPVLAQLLNIAAGAAERCGHGLPGEFSYWSLTPEKLAATGLDEARLDEATRSALERFGPVRAAVG